MKGAGVYVRKQGMSARHFDSSLCFIVEFSVQYSIQYSVQYTVQCSGHFFPSVDCAPQDSLICLRDLPWEFLLSREPQGFSPFSRRLGSKTKEDAASDSP